MQGWWRVLRGVKPYWKQVVISMICAIGVGMSYASGVAVLLPVMKIFVSPEGVHGWANRTVAEKRLNVEILDLFGTINRERKSDSAQSGLIITSANAKSGAPEQLWPNGAVEKRIIHVSAVVNGQNVESSKWFGAKDRPGMVDILAKADAGKDVLLDIEGRTDTAKNVKIALHDAPMYYRHFASLIELLPDDRTQSLIWVMSFFVILCILGSIFRYYQQYIGMTVANRVIMDLRRRMYDRVVQLPTSYFAQKGTSDLMSRLTQDTGTLTEGVSMALGKAVQEPIRALGAFVLALVIDWRMCLLVVLSMPVLGLIIRKFSKRMRRASRGALESWSMMLAIINETLIGVRVVKAYSGEGFERRRFARINKKLLREQMRLNHYGSLSRPTIETLAVIVSCPPMILAAHFVLANQIDREAFFVLLASLVAMLEPMRKLSDVNSKVQQSNAAATRVFEVIDLEPEPNHDHSLPHLAPHRTSIEFRDVTFNYPGHEEIVLNNVNLTVPYGTNVAVVGGNGSGKTTLLTLLSRLYVPTSGQVLVDGVDVGTVSLRSLRKQIGLVTQDTLLFADTVFNNIAYGTRHATREQVLDAARRAFADEFITTVLPEGYDTRVGEHGVRLSGGQKQRIAIARAILHEPSILILDEAMSQIDADSEVKITTALREFTKNRTTFTIAHRFMTVINADMICCLDAGRVAGIGTHAQLLDGCPAYKKLYENQFRDFSADPEVISITESETVAAVQS